MSVFDMPGWKTGEFNHDTYHYLHVKPISPSKKTFLLLSGFPTGVFSFRKIVPQILAEGHGIILPEMLGFGGSSHPKEAEKYSRIAMADAVAGIVAAEGVEKCVVMGHDWGVLIATRFVLKHPQLVESLIQVGIPFWPPEDDPKPFDIQGYNEMFKPLMGFEPIGYMPFLVTKEAPKLISDHVETFIRCIWDSEPDFSSGHTFCDTGTLEANLRADRVPPVPYWATEQEVKDAVDFIKSQDIAAILNYYHFAMFHADKGDAELPKRLTKPYLYIECKHDPTIPAPLVGAQIEHCDNITIKTLQGGHWLMEEEPENLFNGIKEWIDTLPA
ncbi:alpha/beta-hydrolase [Clavulina sp. PMI_390]|nr:alpha/beta-hydrolase [Clavulina sp. PMI_390]